MKLGYIGLGKMGHNMVERLIEHGHEVVVFDQSTEAVKAVREIGAEGSSSLKDLVQSLGNLHFIWLMVPHATVDGVIEELIPLMGGEGVVIDGGNSFFKDSQRRAKLLQDEGIDFLDVGVSGGPGGARHGACLMIGGHDDVFRKFEGLFRDLSVPNGFALVGGPGAGHFAKMVHNGIEYGMMQSLAEGFAILKNSQFSYDLEKLAELYNHGTVIESRLVGWLADGYRAYGQELEAVSPMVGHTGEGEWTAKTAKELGVSAQIIEGSFNFRVQSKDSPSYTGRVLSALRNMFGGHSVK